MRNEQTIMHAPVPASQPAFKGITRPVLVSAVLFMLVTGLAYPLATTGVANLLFPNQAQGSLIIKDGRAVGSRLIGQYFIKPEYFHSRPSVTSGTDPNDPSKTVDQPYNAALSAASNQGAISKKLLDAVAERAKAYREENGLAADAVVPVDLRAKIVSLGIWVHRYTEDVMWNGADLQPLLDINVAVIKGLTASPAQAA